MRFAGMTIRCWPNLGANSADLEPSTHAYWIENKFCDGLLTSGPWGFSDVLGGRWPNGLLKFFLKARLKERCTRFKQWFKYLKISENICYRSPWFVWSWLEDRASYRDLISRTTLRGLRVFQTYRNSLLEALRSMARSKSQVYVSSIVTCAFAFCLWLV